MFSSRPYRIDPPAEPIRRRPASHAPITGAPVTGTPLTGSPAVNRSGVSSEPSVPGPGRGNPPPCDQLASEDPDVCRDQWLRLHADDLITKLQAWAAELDAREKLLNTRSASLDASERPLGLLHQDFENDLARQRRSLQRIRDQVKARAQRLGLEDRTENTPNLTLG